MKSLARGRDIARAEGRVHFAGEHTTSDPFGGSMTGALEGAVRAVLEVMEVPVAGPGFDVGRA